MSLNTGNTTTHTYNAHFRCFGGCAGKYSVYDVIYTCPTCGGLLEVHHDVNALGDRSADEWKALIDTRVGRSQWPYGSGVWGMREWVMPDLRDENVVSTYEGNSNLYWAERLGKQLSASISSLQNDPKAVERLAREKLGWARTNETVIRFEQPARR